MPCVHYSSEPDSVFVMITITESIQIEAKYHIKKFGRIKANWLQDSLLESRVEIDRKAEWEDLPFQPTQFINCLNYWQGRIIIAFIVF